MKSADPGANGHGDGADAMLAEIHVFSKTAQIAKYAVEHGEYIIGRDSTCHIMVEAEAVSRHHARLSFSAFELIIEDLGSSNGVFIEGVQVLIPTRVRPDQEVQIGAARLYVRLSAGAAAQFSAALADKDLGLLPVREMLEGQKYKVITTIGRGGMGVVMQARDVRVRRTVALKVMQSSHQFSRENVLRFVDEAQLTGQLEHPNIVPIYELGTEESGEIFYSMKYVKGTTLDAVLRSLRHGRPQTVEKYPLGALLTIFQKICDAVAFAHSKGVVHRDLKPENVMIGAYGEVLVMDWGLAKNLSGAQRGEGTIETAFATEAAPDPRGFQTLHGLIVGTPPYISPEQARGDLEQIDCRSDVYVLGEILYAILTLRPPIAGGTVPEIVEAILASKITPPTSFNIAPKAVRGVAAAKPEELFELLHLPGRRVPEGLSAVVMKAMQLAPADRYQTVEEMQADIVAYQGGFATKAERAGFRKQALLWAGRHKGEFAVILVAFVVFNVLVASFIYQLAVEKDRALASEQRALENEERAKESELLAAGRLTELRGTAPTFAQEARAQLEDGRFEEALEKIDYALGQVPNEAEYHAVQGRVLQSLLRWDEAIAAFEEALEREPTHPDARRNLGFTRSLAARVPEFADTPPPHLILEYQEELLRQDRVEEARALLTRLDPSQETFGPTWRAVAQKRGLQERVEMSEDQTFRVDLRGLSEPDLRQLADMAVVSLILDDSRAANLLSVKSCPLESLSILRTPITDLSPLAGKKLEELYAGGCRNLHDLTPLRGLPLQRLDLSRTAVTDLTPLRDLPLRELNLEGCAELDDLQPLLAMKQLEAVVIPAHCKEVELLRNHPTLRRLSYKKLTQSVEEFWKEYDVRKGAPAR